MKKRVLIFSVAYEPLIGGAELAVKNLTSRLLDYEFDLISCRFSRTHKTVEKIGNVTVYRVGFGSRFGRLIYPFLAVRFATPLHKQNSYEIVWGIMAAYAGLASLLFKKRFPKVKFLLTLQEGDDLSYIQKRVWMFRKFWQKIFRHADHIQAISTFLADWAKKQGAVCPVAVIPNGVGITNFQVQIPSLQSNTHTQSQKIKIIVTTSRLVPKNGIDILIRAFGILLHESHANSSRLWILGTGREESRLKNLAKELDIEKHIDFFGAIHPDKVPEYLAQADIFVRASRSEGLGSSFLEAMATGLPVIGTRVGGIPEFLVPYDDSSNSFANGLFTMSGDPTDLAEKIKFLIEHETLARFLGQNGRKLVKEKYTWDNIARQMAQIFQTLS